MTLTCWRCGGRLGSSEYAQLHRHLRQAPNPKRQRQHSPGPSDSRRQHQQQQQQQSSDKHRRWSLLGDDSDAPAAAAAEQQRTDTAAHRYTLDSYKCRDGTACTKEKERTKRHPPHARRSFLATPPEPPPRQSRHRFLATPPELAPHVSPQHGNFSSSRMATSSSLTPRVRHQTPTSRRHVFASKRQRRHEFTVRPAQRVTRPYGRHLLSHRQHHRRHRC
jgi:hypothetical protein